MKKPHSKTEEKTDKTRLCAVSCLRKPVKSIGFPAPVRENASAFSLRGSASRFRKEKK